MCGSTKFNASFDTGEYDYHIADNRYWDEKSVVRVKRVDSSWTGGPLDETVAETLTGSGWQTTPYTQAEIATGHTGTGSDSTKFAQLQF